MKHQFTKNHSLEPTEETTVKGWLELYLTHHLT